MAPDPESVCEKVSQQVARNASLLQWNRVLECPEAHFSRTFLGKEHFLSALKILKVYLEAAEINTLWKYLKEDRTQKVPLDVFEKKCLIRNRSILKSRLHNKSSKPARHELTEVLQLKKTDQILYEEVFEHLYLAVCRIAYSVEKRRLRRRRHEENINDKMNLWEAFKCLFFEKAEEHHDTFDKTEFALALRRLGFNGEFSLSPRIVTRLFRSLDMHSKGYVDYHSFSNWMLFAGQKFDKIDANYVSKSSESYEDSRPENDDYEGALMQEGCWQASKKRIQASQDSALKSILLELLQSTTIKRLLAKEMTQSKGEVNSLDFLELLRTLKLEALDDHSRRTLARMMNKDRYGRVQVKRLKELMEVKNSKGYRNFGVGTKAYSQCTFLQRDSICPNVFDSIYSNSVKPSDISSSDESSSLDNRSDVDSNSISDESQCQIYVSSSDSDTESKVSDEDGNMERYENLNIHDSNIIEHSPNKLTGMKRNRNISFANVESPSYLQPQEGHINLIDTQTVFDNPSNVKEEYEQNYDENTDTDDGEIHYSDVEYEEKEGDHDEINPIESTLEITAISCERLDRKPFRRPIFIRASLMPWGIESEYTTTSENGIWTRWRDSRKRCKQKSALMKIKYPDTQIPISLSCANIDVDDHIETRVHKNRPHIMIELYQQRWSIFKSSVSKNNGKCIGKFPIYLGPYLRGNTSKEIEVVRDNVHELHVAVHFKHQ